MPFAPGRCRVRRDLRGVVLGRAAGTAITVGALAAVAPVAACGRRRHRQDTSGARLTAGHVYGPGVARLPFSAPRSDIHAAPL